MDLETDQLLRRALAHHLVTDVEAPGNYSLILASGGRNRKIEQVSLLYQSSQLVVRGRTPSRVLHGLLAYLSAHLDGVEGFRTNALVAIADGQAVMMPPVMRGSLKVLQPHLRRARWQLADVPYCYLDFETAEVVVPGSSLTVDESVLDEIQASEDASKELPYVLPGRYPIRGWACPAETERGTLSRAMAVAATMSAIEHTDIEHTELGIRGIMDALATLFSIVKPVAVPIGRPKEMLGELRASLRL